jgi:hypothetical protein
MISAAHNDDNIKLPAKLNKFITIAAFLIEFTSQSVCGNEILFAGASSVNINPVKLPAHVGGMFIDRTSSVILDNLFSRALVLDDGNERIAIVVVDSCMIPRDLLDKAKAI